jgi:uncharacterized membrane protein YeaQ/YmgE (transglycosylase-associated protein family)
MWFDPELLRQFARISAVASQGLGVLILGVVAGLAADAIWPSLGQAGVVFGGILGAVGSVLATALAARRLMGEADDQNKEEPGK